MEEAIMVYCTVDDCGNVVSHSSPQTNQVAICPRVALCGLVVLFDGSVKFDENKYIVERLKRMTNEHSTWSPAQTVNWLIVQAKRFSSEVNTTRSLYTHAP